MVCGVRGCGSTRVPCLRTQHCLHAHAAQLWPVQCLEHAATRNHLARAGRQRRSGWVARTRRAPARRTAAAAAKQPGPVASCSAHAGRPHQSVCVCVYLYVCVCVCLLRRIHHRAGCCTAVLAAAKQPACKQTGRRASQGPVPPAARTRHSEHVQVGVEALCETECGPAAARLEQLAAG